MEVKNVRNMTNSELRLYQKALEDEYEVVKAKIAELFKELDTMDVTYNKVEAELNNRKLVKI